ncbi:hypothetical protein [Ensifer sp. YR511]|uniref:hypothetical protein n=1 Tax=Ensifer sp. YR511 TaxID=1855294 RepID=UPI000B800A2D|nr:hypothetical protein [Ensifer sp. YR511]
MPKNDKDNAIEAVKAGSSSEFTGVSKENDTAEIDPLATDVNEIPGEEINIYLDEFELSRLIMDSAINKFEKSINTVK